MTRLLVLIYTVSFLMACSPQIHFCKTTSNNQGITRVEEEDSTIVAFIAPYKEQLAEEMNAPIGTVAVTLTKAQPECTLGNWAVDVIQAQAELYAKQRVDFTVLNYGGLRIPSLPKGDLPKGKIYELMPFDNYIVLVKMKGSELDALFNHIAQKGGWPVSGAVRLIIEQGKATQCLINGEKIEADKEYYVATNDYLAKGGDQCSFFVDKEKIKTGALIRDAMLEYIYKNKAPINATIEGRIVQQ